MGETCKSVRSKIVFFGYCVSLYPPTYLVSTFCLMSLLSVKLRPNCKSNPGSVPFNLPVSLLYLLSLYKPSPTRLNLLSYLLWPAKFKVTSKRDGQAEN